jgi:hypothetical protein
LLLFSFSSPLTLPASGSRRFKEADAHDTTHAILINDGAVLFWLTSGWVASAQMPDLNNY